MSRSRRSQPSFLTIVDSGEREVARLLTLITGVVILAALVQLVTSLGSKLLTGSEATWLGDDLIKVLGDLLTVLIALEVLQNITSYLRRHVVQIELVLVTALTAVARKVIVLPSGLKTNHNCWWAWESLLSPCLRPTGWSSAPMQGQPQRSRGGVGPFDTMSTIRRTEPVITHTEIDLLPGVVTTNARTAPQQQNPFEGLLTHPFPWRSRGLV